MTTRKDGPELRSWLRAHGSDAAGGTDGAGGGAGAGGAVRVSGGASGQPALGAGRLAAAPARLPSEHEQAAHELALAAALVLNAPEAARALELLAGGEEVHPQGAVVFACLLFITGREEAAQFWWQFAAGSGNDTAAYCLHLYHLTLGETRDAGYWRAQAEALAAPPVRVPSRRVRLTRPLLPEDVRRDILSRCHEGLDPRLPATLEAVVNHLAVDSDDEDFGEIPRPSRTLAGELAVTRIT
ncbi:hypothetical protein AB0D08_39325 [Kitasatospora sp. NPDC048540]|uniref:hypothetical protein n=1 Tax=Kitasatospora sp. NPDC048540 TaxID=3155634 RepID=UPI00340AB6FC